MARSSSRRSSTGTPFGSRRVQREEERYNLDVIISVGYRVKSQRGVEFRRWATGVLSRCIIDGHAENTKRLEQLGQVARVMARILDSLETRQVLGIVVPSSCNYAAVESP